MKNVIAEFKVTKFDDGTEKWAPLPPEYRKVTEYVFTSNGVETGGNFSGPFHEDEDFYSGPCSGIVAE